MIDSLDINITMQRWNERCFNGELPAMSAFMGATLSADHILMEAVFEPSEPIPHQLHVSAKVMQIDHSGLTNLLLHELCHHMSTDYTHGELFQEECRRVARVLDLEYGDDFTVFPLTAEESKWVRQSMDQIEARH